jgi:hypothetical protein
MRKHGTGCQKWPSNANTARPVKSRTRVFSRSRSVRCRHCCPITATPPKR